MRPVGRSGRLPAAPGNAPRPPEKAAIRSIVARRDDILDVQRLAGLRRQLPVALAAALAVTTVLAALGFLQALQVVTWPRFSLEAEYTPASAWSALLLVLAGVAAALSASVRGSVAGWWLAGLFGYMACDEAFAVHESLERVTGVDWQLLFSPVIAVAAVAFLMVLRAVDRRDVRWTLLAAACAWTVAQVFEKLEWHGAVRQPHYTAMMLAEETLEMLGSTLFAAGFALLASSEAADALARRDPTPSARRVGARRNVAHPTS
jgi:hypothetical protein